MSVEVPESTTLFHIRGQDFTFGLAHALALLWHTGFQTVGLQIRSAVACSICVIACLHLGELSRSSVGSTNVLRVRQSEER